MAFKFLVNEPFNLHFYKEDGVEVEFNDLHEAVDYLQSLKDNLKYEIDIRGGEENEHNY